jgi:hypothetical protein
VAGSYSRLKYATEQTFELTPLPCWSHPLRQGLSRGIAALVPSRTKKSSAPFYHAATKAVRKAFWQAYAAFVSAFREAADRWREGDRSARFPVGSFPPGLPFVTAEAYSPP